MIVKIPLSRGEFALVDEEDVPRLAKHKWSLAVRRDRKYAESRINGRNTMMHRFVLDAPPDMQVDHKNNDGLDNTRANLRLATHAANKHNTGAHRDSASRFKGVWWSRDVNKWRAQISVGRQRFGLGCFDLEEDAARAYDARAREFHGEFAKLNFPE